MLPPSADEQPRVTEPVPQLLFPAHEGLPIQVPAQECAVEERVRVCAQGDHRGPQADVHAGHALRLQLHHPVRPPRRRPPRMGCGAAVRRAGPAGNSAHGGGRKHGGTNYRCDFTAFNT
eukprot:6551634-Pyramimonas_sp.AAC.2